MGEATVNKYDLTLFTVVRAPGRCALFSYTNPSSGPTEFNSYTSSKMSIVGPQTHQSGHITLITQ
jgi:hypothetical protein